MKNIEIEGINELSNYELLFSFKKKAYYGLMINHYFYKGKFFNVHISLCNHGKQITWVISYGHGDDEDTYEDMMDPDGAYIMFKEFSKHKAINLAKVFLELTK